MGRKQFYFPILQNGMPLVALFCMDQIGFSCFCRGLHCDNLCQILSNSAHYFRSEFVKSFLVKGRSGIYKEKDRSQTLTLPLRDR